MESEGKFMDVKSIYEIILSIFALNPGDGLPFGAIINKLCDENNEVLTVINADDEQQSPDFTILREGKICLSENKKAFIIEQKGKDEENEMILVYLDNGRVMVSKGNVIKKIIDKGFKFDPKNMIGIPKYKPNFLTDEENNNNYNNNDVINNVGSHDNNINQFDELQNHQNDTNPWSNIGGYDLSCLDCCHCFGRQHSI